MSCKFRNAVKALRYRVILGDIGDVYFGNDETEAREMFDSYVKTGKLGDKARTFDGNTAFPSKKNVILEINGEIAGYHVFSSE